MSITWDCICLIVPFALIKGIFHVTNLHHAHVFDVTLAKLVIVSGAAFHNLHAVQ